METKIGKVDNGCFVISPLIIRFNTAHSPFISFSVYRTLENIYILYLYNTISAELIQNNITETNY